MKNFIQFINETSQHADICNCPICQKKKTKFPSKLNDNFAIADYIEEYSNGYVDREQIEEYFRGLYAELKEVDIDSIKEGNAEGNIRIVSKEKKYLKMGDKNIPPIIVDKGVVIDGNHRYRIAKQLGKKTILIYDIKEI